MSIHEAVIPLSLFLTVGVIWGGYILSRHRERMAIIEKGLNPQDLKALYERAARPASPLLSLKWGIVFVAIGAAVLIGMWLHAAFGVDEGAIAGLIAMMGGIGLIVFYVIAGRKAEV